MSTDKCPQPFVEKVTLVYGQILIIRRKVPETNNTEKKFFFAEKIFTGKVIFVVAEIIFTNELYVWNDIHR